MEQPIDLTVKLFSTLVTATKQSDQILQDQKENHHKDEKYQRILGTFQERILNLMESGTNWLSKEKGDRLNHDRKPQKTQNENRMKNKNKSKNKKKNKSNKKNKNNDQETNTQTDFLSILELNSVVFDRVEDLLSDFLRKKDSGNKREETKSGSQEIFASQFEPKTKQKMRTNTQDLFNTKAKTKFVKPQLKFQDPIDNSNKPFQPRLKSKPNSKLPLDQSLLKMKKDGTMNPYSYEINSFKLSPRQLHYYETKKEILESSKYNFNLNSKGYKWVDCEEDLKSLCKLLSKHSEFAVQIHEHRKHSYQGFACCISISTQNNDYAIDAIKLRSKLNLLLNVFTNPKIVKIMINAQQALLALQRDFGLYIVNLFDITEASKLMGVAKPFKLKSILKQFFFFKSHPKKTQFFNVKKNKGIQSLFQTNLTIDYQFRNNFDQNNDWRIRPLPSEMLRYSRKFTQCIFLLYQLLKTTLAQYSVTRSKSTTNNMKRKGNNSKKNNNYLQKLKQNLIIRAFEKSKELCLRGYRKPTFDPNDFLKLYNNENENYLFDSLQLYVFSQLNRWRDDIARIEDESVSSILSNKNMLLISKTIPNSQESLLSLFEEKKIPIFIQQYFNQIIELNSNIIKIYQSNKNPKLMKEFELLSKKANVNPIENVDQQKKRGLDLNNKANSDGDNNGMESDSSMDISYTPQNIKRKKKKNKKQKTSSPQLEIIMHSEKKKSKKELQQMISEINSNVIFEISDSEASDSNGEEMGTSSPFFYLKTPQKNDLNNNQNQKKKKVNHNNLNVFEMSNEKIKRYCKITPPEQFAPKTQKEIYELSNRNRKRNKEKKKTRAQKPIPNPSPLDLLNLNVKEEGQSGSGSGLEKKYSSSNSISINSKKNNNNTISQLDNDPMDNLKRNKKFNSDNSSRKRKESVGGNVDSTMKFMRTIGWVNDKTQENLVNQNVMKQKKKSNSKKVFHKNNQNYNNNSNYNNSYNRNNNHKYDNNYGHNSNNGQNYYNNGKNNKNYKNNNNHYNSNNKFRNNNYRQEWNQEDQYNHSSQNNYRGNNRIYKPQPNRNTYHQSKKNHNQTYNRNYNSKSRNDSNNHFSNYAGNTWNKRGRSINTNYEQSKRIGLSTNNVGFKN
ncbi:exosome component [Anaeramoeba flamelloides]|uniref:Exosome component n=1 Tax=Anaeramoeba flamelloides TaxID=1746091 RepID=A0AAV8AD74_9EUKA|nr:exosome component [Anaeramoeba flamelloides]